MRKAVGCFTPSFRQDTKEDVTRALPEVSFGQRSYLNPEREFLHAAREIKGLRRGTL